MPATSEVLIAPRIASIQQEAKLLAWAKELESGNYRQASGFLCSYAGDPEELENAWFDQVWEGEIEEGPFPPPSDEELAYCCLGVMCEISPQVKEKLWYGDSSPGYSYTFPKLGGEGERYRADMPPAELLAEYGLVKGGIIAYSEMGAGALSMFLRTGNASYLATANDCGASFETIAKTIREYVRNGGPTNE